MKIIQYKAACGAGEEIRLYDRQILCEEAYLQSNLEIVKREAYNGEYTVEDDGQPDPGKIPSQLDIIEAQVTYTAMMTDTLLEV